MTVILSSLTTTFTFSPLLEKGVFNIAGIPYCPPRTPSDRKALKEIKKLCYEKIYEAVDTDYSIILINNTPLTLQVLEELQGKSGYPNASDWLIVSLFHDDNTLINNKIKLTDTLYVHPQILLDDKTKDIKNLSTYPFIKKVVIPHNFQITPDYIKTLNNL